MRTRLYVGYTLGAMAVFRSATEPTFKSHGHLYNAVIGPFQTRRGADFMAQYGRNNPHVQHVRDAERIARSL